MEWSDLLENQRKPIKEHPGKNILASVLFGLFKKSQCWGLLNLFISIQVFAAWHMQIPAPWPAAVPACVGM